MRRKTGFARIGVERRAGAMERAHCGDEKGAQRCAPIIIQSIFLFLSIYTWKYLVLPHENRYPSAGVSVWGAASYGILVPSSYPESPYPE
jgi:hypothetical protein